jgi:hypothetical protein
MPDIRLDDFSGGMTDFYVNGAPNQGRRFVNLLVDENNRPYIRPGSEIWGANVAQIPAGAQRISKMARLSISELEVFIFAFSHTKCYYSMVTVNVLGQEQTMPAWTELKGPVVSTAGLGTTFTQQAFSVNATAQSRVHVTNCGSHLLITELQDVQATGTNGRAPKKIYLQSGGLPQLRSAGLPAVSNLSLWSALPVASPGSVGTTKSYKYYFVPYVTYTLFDGTVFEDRGEPYLVTVTTSADIAGGGASVSWSVGKLAQTSGTHYDVENIKTEVYRTTNGGTTAYRVGIVNNGSTVFADLTTDASLVSGVVLYTHVDGSRPNTQPPQAQYTSFCQDAAWYLNCAAAFTGDDTSRALLKQSIPGDIDSVPGEFSASLDDEGTGIGALDLFNVVFTANKAWRAEGLYDAQGRGGFILREISGSYGCISHDGIVKVGNQLIFPSKRGFCVTDGYTVQPISEHLSHSYTKLTKSLAQRNTIAGKYDPIGNRVYWTFKRDQTLNISSTTLISENDHVWVLDLDKPLSQRSCFTSWEDDGSRNFTATAFEISPVGELLRGDSRGYIFVHRQKLMTDPLVNTAASYTTWPNAAVRWEWESCATNFGTDRSRKLVTSLSVVLRNEIDYRSINFSTAVIDNVASPLRVTLSDLTNYDWPTGDELLGRYIFFSSDNYALGYKINTRLTDALLVDDPTGSLPDGTWDWIIRSGSGFQSVAIDSCNDDSGDWRPLKTVRKRGDVKPIYTEDRYFPAGTLRSMYKQVRLSTPNVVIANSTDLGMGQKATSTTFTLVSSATRDFPVDIVGMKIYFPLDDYATGYTVTARSADTLTFASLPAGLALATPTAWVIKGYPRDEKFRLEALTMTFDMMSQSTPAFQKPETGET